MIYDRQITITVGASRKSVNWQAQTLILSEFYARLGVPARGTESMQEYLKLPKTEQDNLKDVGGFVAGTLNGTRRKSNAVTGRDIITLDLDNIPSNATQNVIQRVAGLGCGYCVYSTRKHSAYAPRLRVLIPLDRSAAADEYEPLARKVAEIIGLEFFDPTTFEASRLMYFPSCCSDGEYVYVWEDKPFISADGVLAMYGDWRDVTSWPQVPGAENPHVKLAVRQGDPLTKNGVVGAFCRTFDIRRAIETFLPGIYAPVDDTPNRYTYLGGSTTGGAVTYEGKFLYSHHATDPCSGRLVNAFDLVRLHMFADADDDAAPGTPAIRLPSYTKTIEFAMANNEVSAAVAKERMAAAADFAAVSEENYDWAAGLQKSAQGGYQRSMHNYTLVLQHHPALHGCVKMDLLSNKKIASEELPWQRCAEDTSVWGDEDTTELCIWLEKIFGKVTRSDVKNVLNALALRQSFHPVRDYLNSLEWDCVPRLDTFFMDYMGVKEEPRGYTQAVSRKSLVAAVARVMEPGCKYDYMPVLIGRQGGKKSMLFDVLAGGSRFFSDSLKTFEGQKAQEGVRGKWIIEIAEMQTLDKANVNAAKGFMTQRSDYYRAAYGEEAKDYPRQCAFFGTSNDYECLRDETGGRRMWPLVTDKVRRKKDVARDLPKERDQIWAEAVVYWKLGETLYLPPEQEEIASEIQEEHREAHPWEDTIIDFLGRDIPADWDVWDASARSLFLSGNMKYTGELKPRSKICIAEIWLEALGGISINRMSIADKRVIRNVLSNLTEWEKSVTAMRFGRVYGVQKGYTKRPDL